MKLFPILDQVLTESETGKAKSVLTPGVWPSEASAERLDKKFNPVVGACHRKSYYRMTGVPVVTKTDPVSAWRWVTGRNIEEHVVTLAKLAEPKIWVASGVRLFIKDLIMPLEMDLIVLDPATKQACVVECKTFYGYAAKKELTSTGAGPKLENLMQVCLYLIEVQNGAKLKHLILESLEVQTKDLTETGKSRNRIQADLDILKCVNDGPVVAKLIYISRDECERIEFDISIIEDFDGYHYPAVNGIPYKIFTIESMYQRYDKLQDYWFAARTEGIARLKAKNITPPEFLALPVSKSDVGILNPLEGLTEDQLKLANDYLDKLEKEVRALPDSFLPPAEYEWSYSPSKIEEKFAAGQLPKTKYNAYKKGKITKLGDWVCNYCNYLTTCLPKQKPELSYMVYDMTHLQNEDTEVEFE